MIYRTKSLNIPVRMTEALQFLLSGEHLCDIKGIKEDREMEGFKNHQINLK